MVSHLESAGARLFTFPRTISFGNWPFLVFLAFLATVLSIIPARDGNWLIVAALFGAVAIAPTLIAVVLYVSEPFGRRRISAIHEQGIIWRRGWRRGFMPWSDLAKIERKDHVVEGITFPSWELEDAATGSKPLILEDHPGCEEGAQLIASRISQR
jgi:hypothetical protein